MKRVLERLLRQLPKDNRYDAAEYLSEFLSDDEIARSINDAINYNKVVIISGDTKTGKSTLKAVLNKCGVRAVEKFETIEIICNKVIENPKVDFLDKFREKGGSK